MRADDIRPGSFRVALLGEVTKRVTPSCGGTGVNLIRLGNALLDGGLEIDVVMAHRGNLDSYGEDLSPAVRRVAIGRRKRLLQMVALMAYLLTSRPLFLVAQDSRGMDLAIAVCRLLPRPPRLICVIHNERVVRAEHDPQKERHKVRRFQRVAAYADALVGVSPGLISAIAKRVDLTAIATETIPSPGYPRAAVRAALAAPMGRPVTTSRHILCVGRFSPQKDQATLLRAFAAIRQQGVHAHLTLLGEGPDRPGLEALIRELGIEDCVHLPGFVTNPIAYMVDADLLVLSSVQEAFGLVIVEALAVGLPVVSTDCRYGPRFILEDGKYGQLVPVGDVAAMAGAIMKTCHKPQDQHALIRRAKDFDATTIGKRYMVLFKTLLERPGRDTNEVWP